MTPRVAPALLSPDTGAPTGPGRRVSLNEATVNGDVSLKVVEVKDDVSLERVRIGGYLSLYEMKVKGTISLEYMTVTRFVSLRCATVGVCVSLDGLKVDGDLFLTEITVQGDVSLDRVTVQGDGLLGPLSVGTRLSLADAKFTQSVALRGTAERVDLSGARVLGGLNARIGGAQGALGTEVVMERVEVRSQAILARESAASASPLRLLSLAGSDVTWLTLNGVDLSACHFSGTINLDGLHIDGAPQLAMRQGWQAHRRVLVEESKWWEEYGLWTDFTYAVFLYEGVFNKPSRQCHSSKLGARNALIARERAHEIAGVYRALRKGREDSKDEPGAADFYYGEMEMRRKAAGFSVEGMLLTGYWLLLGYGLRAWRALTALVVVLGAAAMLFKTAGIAAARDTVYVQGSQPNTYESAKSNARAPKWDDAFDYTWQYSTSLVRPIPDPPELTRLGRLLEITLRLVGPGLLALIVLAIRARVKR